METAVKPPRPRSAVSTGVGMVGLTGLALWLAIALSLGLGGRYWALANVLACGIPMVVWSLVVDKVHRNPTSGIDWDERPRSFAEARDISLTKLAGLWATWAGIAAFYCIARWYWRGNYLFAMELFAWGAAPLFVLSIPYVLWLDRVLVNPRDGAWHFGAMLIGREAYGREEVWKHLRAWAVKGFFTAFMVSILPGLFGEIVRVDFSTLGSDPVAISRLAISCMFLLDVQIGTVGYIMTLKPLDAQIRSANPFLAGWLAALLCYPPFVMMGTGALLTYEVNTQDWSVWFAGKTALLWVWGTLLVVLTAIYGWATVIFGLRFSNLTYRGVLTNGPYAFTRHPAYLSKNLFWWCSTLPFFVTSNSLTDVVRNCFFLAVTNAIYFWRAKTEEAHLSLEDPKYVEYSRWMEQNGLITSAIKRLGQRVRPQRGALQLAE
jgi:protein-S-isoprenylcysteine O-methyltransferase Ste14